MLKVFKSIKDLKVSNSLVYLCLVVCLVSLFWTRDVLVGATENTYVDKNYEAYTLEQTILTYSGQSASKAMLDPVNENNKVQGFFADSIIRQRPQETSTLAQAVYSDGGKLVLEYKFRFSDITPPADTYNNIRLEIAAGGGVNKDIWSARVSHPYCNKSVGNGFGVALVVDNWYKWKAEIDTVSEKFKLYLYDSDGFLIQQTSEALLPAADTIDYAANGIKTIKFSFSGATSTIGTPMMWIDDIKFRLNSPVNEVVDAVRKAEISKLHQDVEVAQLLINAITNDNIKNPLQQRLDELIFFMNTVLTVKNAEETQLQSDVDIARNNVNNLLDSLEKTELKQRINKVVGFSSLTFDKDSIDITENGLDNGNITAKITVNNNSPDFGDIPVSLVMVLYKEVSGFSQMRKIKFTEVFNIASMDSRVISETMAIDEIDSDNYSLIVYVLNNYLDMNPILYNPIVFNRFGIVNR